MNANLRDLLAALDAWLTDRGFPDDYKTLTAAGFTGRDFDDPDAMMARFTGLADHLWASFPLSDDDDRRPRDFTLAFGDATLRCDGGYHLLLQDGDGLHQLYAPTLSLALWGFLRDRYGKGVAA